MKMMKKINVYFACFIFFLSAVHNYAQNHADSIMTTPTINISLPDSIATEEEVIVKVEVTAQGDTIYHYKRKAFDFGDVYNKAPVQVYREESEGMERSSIQRQEVVMVERALSVNAGKDVGQIPFSEGMTPSGGKTYSVPITTAPVISSAPQIAIAYNSQAGNGVAGYGWNITGISAITVAGKSIHYDAVTGPVNLSAPDECVFSLDGTRLVSNNGPLSGYQYETAQGFVLVKKHTYASNAAYFTVAYPNGNTATFGYTNNTTMKHVYPVKEIKDIKGYITTFDYIESGNNYYLKKISYGGKTTSDHQAEIEFNYIDRTDFTTAYISTIPVSGNKLLKSVVSRNKVNGIMQELCTYSLTHVLNEVQQLTQIDCTSANSSLTPLYFSYGDHINNQPGRLTKEYEQLLFKYFPNTPEAMLVFRRGKFIKNKFGDGLITFPGKFSPYTKTGERVKKFLGFETGRYPFYGSGYPADQNILIAPGLSFLSNTQTIKTEEGFQTIEAIDVNGDGTDEIVKVNFGDLSGDNTMLKITIYTHSGGSFSSQSFTVPVRGVVNNQNQTTSPMSRSYFFGDFKGTGKAQLLTVSHNKAFTGAEMTSYFALIDLDSRHKLSETTLFAVDPSDGSYIYPLDMDGDGKMELCYATSSGLDVYGLSGNSFTKRYITTSITRNQLYNKDILWGDLNADGKIDILVPPANSYQDLRRVDIPIWAPHNCPFCRGREPLSNSYDTHCRHCRKDLKESYVSKIRGARCRVDNCDTGLDECGNSNSYHPENNNKLCCPTHGYMFTEQVDFGYIDNGNSWTAYLSTGEKFIPLSMSIVNKEYSDNYVLMDINNDGNADLLKTRKTQVDLYLNKNGIIQSVSAGSVAIPASTKILPANVYNYYGMSHFIAVENAEVNCYKFTKNNSRANLLTSLTDSYGNKHINKYVGMNEKDTNYYPTSTNRYYPYFSFIAPLNLLQSTDVYTGNITIKQYYYSYFGAVMHRTGLGFCGFEKVTTRDNIQNIETTEEKNPELFGVTTRVTSPLMTASYSYNRNESSNKKANPQLTYTYQEDKLKNIYSYTWYTGYDSYNNPTKVETVLSDNSVKTVVTQTYDNITTLGRYLIGQPLIKTVTATRGGSSWTNKEVITYRTDRLPETKTTYTGAQGNQKTGTVKWDYYPGGMLKSEKSAPYNVTELSGNTYEYDAQNRPVKTTNALGQVTVYANFDKYGNARTITDHKGRVTRREYNIWGEPVSTVYPDGTAETVTAAWGGQGLYTVTQTATGKPATVVHYDVLGREVRKGNQRFNGQWQFTDNVYDRRGRLEKTSLPFKGSSPTHWNTYTYDTYNRPTKITEASGKTTSWSYNGLSVTETKNGIATTKTTDASGALISVSDPGGIITYALRADGQPSSITAPGGVVTSFGYDAFGRQTSIADPSAGTQTFTESFTAAGVRTSTVKDANGKTVTTISDKYGRITHVNRPEFNTSYVYNTDGLLTGETSGNGTSAVFTYDTYGRPATTRENAPDGKWLQKTFAYAAGNVASVQYTSQNGNIGTENFVYANGHNTEIKLNNTTSIWKLTEENALAQPTKATTGAMARTYGYTAFGMPTGRTAGTVQNFTYSFDVHKGNLLSRTDGKRSKTETFGYDHLNRLSSMGTQQISYADNGNITQMPEVGALLYKNSAKPYAISEIALSRDAIPLREQQITYTSFQRPNSISENGITATFAYTAGGDRVKMHVMQATKALLTRYYIGKQYELDAQTNTERLYLGGDAYSAPAVYVKEANVWKIYYICRDYLGSITHVANADGSLKAEYSYDAWGRLRNPATQVAYAAGSEPALFLGRGYTGHEHLPWFGLINMNARLYDPLLGRFLSPDPYVQMPDFTQNFNRYSYGLNNPLVYVDEDGELASWIIGAIVGVFFYAKAAHDNTSKANQGNPLRWNWLPWNWSKPDQVVLHFGSNTDGSGMFGGISAGQAGQPRPMVGYSKDKGPGVGYHHNSNSNMYHPQYEYNKSEKAALASIDQAQKQYEWLNGPLPNLSYSYSKLPSNNGVELKMIYYFKSESYYWY
ncbi:MAG: RHS repeat-associated core domain-containing protein, partial [Bacteroidia bacterium]|nr:RHS repeat-associated core domain-containing protein [Bacteroidia bacterium]